MENNKLIVTTIDTVNADTLENKMRDRLEKIEEKIDKKIDKQDEAIEEIKKETKESINEHKQDVNKKLDLMETRDVERDKEYKENMRILQEENKKLAASNGELKTLVIRYQTANTEALAKTLTLVVLLAEQLQELQKLVRQGAQKVAEEIKDPEKDIIAPLKASDEAMLREVMKAF